MSRRYGGSSETKVYVGDLGNDATKEEIEEAFGYYGSLRNVWVARNPPGFAFVEFDDLRDAEDAVRNLDGKRVCGRRVRVEISTGKAPRNRGGRTPSRRMKPFNPSDSCYRCGKRGHYAYDCDDKFRRRSASRSRSRSPRRRPRSRSRSPVRRRSRSASPRAASRSRSRSASYPKRGGSGAAARKGASRSPSRSRTRSPVGRRSRSVSDSPPPRRGARASRSRSPRGRNGRGGSRSDSD